MLTKPLAHLPENELDVTRIGDTEHHGAQNVKMCNQEIISRTSRGGRQKTRQLKSREKTKLYDWERHVTRRRDAALFANATYEATLNRTATVNLQTPRPSYGILGRVVELRGEGDLDWAGVVEEADEVSVGG